MLLALSTGKMSPIVLSLRLNSAGRMGSLTTMSSLNHHGYKPGCNSRKRDTSAALDAKIK